MFGFGKSSSPSEWVIKNVENGLYVTVGTFETSEGGIWCSPFPALRGRLRRN